MKFEPYIHKELQDLLAVEELSLRPDPHAGRLLATLCDLMTTSAEQGAELRGLRERVEELEAEDEELREDALDREVSSWKGEK